ncbi:enolase C-terminal domain-like protein [Chryseobacterium sp. A301]
MELRWKVRKLILKEPFHIAYGQFDYRNALLVELSEQDVVGFGECVEITYYGIVLSDFEKELSRIRRLVKQVSMVTPQEFYLLLKKWAQNSFLRSALDCAYWDLYGKLEGKSFGELNSIVGPLPISSLTLSGGSSWEQVQKIKSSEWSFFKVKFVEWNPLQLVALLEAGKKIAIDANTSFGPEDCKRLEASLNVEKLVYVEQPLKVGDYKVLSRNSKVNWMGDEDFQSMDQLADLQPHYPSLNLKLMKCGGLTPALEVVKKAKEYGFRVMIGCMTESSVGISAGIALAPLCDYADLDGAELIANDDAVGSKVYQGELQLERSPGLGIQMKT